jgi:hypothetical protein
MAMYFQKVLKGISGLKRNDATDMVMDTGILSNWWRLKNRISTTEIKVELTHTNLIHHLNDYNKPLPAYHRWASLGKTYGEVSAFISTTAGAIQRDGYLKTNILFPPFLTVLDFATKGFKTDGYIFYAYLTTLGKPSVVLQGFAEEVRELHTYTNFMPFHHQGEITAKISIPSVNIEKAEYYDGPQALKELKLGNLPTPGHAISNPAYASPDNYTNIREIL